jgi:hypothetical protein
MTSPVHRQNILGTQYTDIGVGVACGVGSRPYWVQVFGRKMSTPPSPTAPGPTVRPTPGPSPTPGATRGGAAGRPNPQREQWLVAFGSVQTYSLTDEPLWRTAPGDWYRVNLTQPGWVLAVREGDAASTLVWIPASPDVGLTSVWRVCP